MIECPTCGESEDLSGSPAADDIEITCGACGAVWRRGDPRCKGCGAPGGVPRRQVMTRTPRGNQVAVVGHREVVLCRSCDADVVAESSSAPVPEGYVSVFLFGRDLPETRTAAAEPRPAVTPAPAPAARAQARPTTSKRAEPPPPPDTRHPAPPRALAEPTARQAIEAHLEADAGADSLTMLMLGRHLGPSRRIRDLDQRAEQERLRRWFDETWSQADPGRREAARAALADALTLWRARGWLRPDTLQRLD